MLNLESLRVFVKVAELGSFTRAARQLGLGKARVSLRLSALEAELGAHLVQRSTRVVRLTTDGENLLPHARRLLRDSEEIGGLFQGGRTLRGSVSIDLPMGLGRDFVLPRLPELLERHPGLELAVSTTDRLVEPVREGFDCILRVGAPRDPDLVGRRLGVLAMVNCASPSYLKKYGTPARLEDLDRHFIVHYSANGEGAPSFEYPLDGGYAERPMRALLRVNSTDTYFAACLAGLGIVQIPRSPRLLASFAVGSAVEVLPEYACAPMAVSLLHTHGRSAPRRVRVVMDWLDEVITNTISTWTGAPAPTMP